MRYLIVFSHLRWNFVFQRPQHLLSRLARHYRVVFVEEPVRADVARLERTAPCANVEVLRPHTPVAAPGFHDDQLPVLKALLAEHFAAHAIDDYLVWLYTPMALPLLTDLAPRAVVYDCMDELSAFKDAPKQMRQRETALLKCAQVVLTGGPSLYESKRRLHPNVLCLPSAVDAAHYAPSAAATRTEPMARAAALQEAIPGPRLGFFGVIDERLDVDIVAALADADPAWHVVMVGPVVKIDPARLPRRPNLHWLGQQPYELLPQLVAGWDACITPFALNEATRYISPTKTLEYMAAGKPVVSTGIHDVRAMFSDVVRIADGPEAFVAACRATLDETPLHRAERFAAMQACVWRYSWDDTAEAVHRAIESVLLKAAPPPAAPASIEAALLPAATVVAGATVLQAAAVLPTAAVRPARVAVAAADAGDRKLASAG
jgi:glycosyltransferase involved in cell wall biosynthesis